MIKNKYFYSVCVLSALLVGCETVKPVAVERDHEPVLTGIPVSEKVAASESLLNNQIELLNKITEKKPVGTYNVVTHDNSLDARVGSNMTIPKSYAFPVKEKEILNKPEVLSENSGNNEKKSGDVVEAKPLKNEEELKALKEKERIESELKAKHDKEMADLKSKNDIKNLAGVSGSDLIVKKIIWKNQSFNGLIKNLANIIGYEVVVSGPVSDKEIDYTAENKSVGVILNELSVNSSGYADLIIINKNKTINIFYK
jgi:hypothetical protein